MNKEKVTTVLANATDFFKQAEKTLLDNRLLKATAYRLFKIRFTHFPGGNWPQYMAQKWVYHGTTRHSPLTSHKFVFDES